LEGKGENQGLKELHDQGSFSWRKKLNSKNGRSEREVLAPPKESGQMRARKGGKTEKRNIRTEKDWALFSKRSNEIEWLESLLSMNTVSERVKQKRVTKNRKTKGVTNALRCPRRPEGRW